MVGGLLWDETGGFTVKTAIYLTFLGLLFVVTLLFGLSIQAQP
jgi:hypothetical protein